MKDPFRRDKKLRLYQQEMLDNLRNLNFTLNQSRSKAHFIQIYGRFNRLLNFETLTEYKGVSTEA